MSKPNQSFLGLADCYLKPYGVAAAARAIGSVSRCEITHEEDEKRQQNFGRDGGTLNIVSRLTKAGINLTLQSISKENLALALRGTVSSAALGTVVAEAQTAYKGGLVSTAFMSPTVTEVTNAGDTVTYDEGVDYRVTGAGIVILETGTITEAQPILISYSHPAIDVVEALTTGATEYTLYFDGLNEAENNSNVSVVLHRAKFKLATTLGLISDDYVNLEVEGELLLDASQIGTGKSKFYRWSYPKAA